MPPIEQEYSNSLKGNRSFRPTERNNATTGRVTKISNSNGRTRQTKQRKQGDRSYQTQRSSKQAEAQQQAGNASTIPDDHRLSTYLREPETRPIGQEQLVAEVKGIYAGLVMVESKCIEVDNAQSSQSDVNLNDEQWQAMTALHRTLLHEHCDFLMASQHPSATIALRRLASKYAMPARMWRHAIHSYLELLRHRLPHSNSLEHMLAFIYLAYSMVALLYETLPAFTDTWIECLGDLGRYRMAIEDEDMRDREIWTSVSRHWYSKASDNAPTTGRLYQHLAILARPNALQQLFYYTKSLCVPIPFTSARESIMTLFEPVIKGSSAPRLVLADWAFVKAHGLLFINDTTEEFDVACLQFLQGLHDHIDATSHLWMQSGYYVAIANCCALLSYGKENNVIVQAIRPTKPEDGAERSVAADGTSDKETEIFLQQAFKLVEGTHEVVLKRPNDPNVLPYVHVILTFMAHLASHPKAMHLVQRRFPWSIMASFLNSICFSNEEHDGVDMDEFPMKSTVKEGKELPRPLPEDYAMKGLLWIENYFPAEWFSNDKIEDDEKYFQTASVTEGRKERILWLGRRIARHKKWLLYDETTQQFSANPSFDRKVQKGCAFTYKL